jgi:protein associated with RNAse G/E
MNIVVLSKHKVKATLCLALSYFESKTEFNVITGWRGNFNQNRLSVWAYRSLQLEVVEVALEIPISVD